MRVSSARENAQVTHLLTAKRSARDHAFNGFFQNAFRETTLQHLGSGHALDTASITGVLVVNLVLQLLARELHLVGVDHDDIVTAIHMRGEARLMLAAQDAGDDRCGAADDQSFGVNEKPFLFHSRDRKSVGSGKSVSVRLDLGGRRIIKQKKKNK